MRGALFVKTTFHLFATDRGVIREFHGSFFFLVKRECQCSTIFKFSEIYVISAVA